MRRGRSDRKRRWLYWVLAAASTAAFIVLLTWGPWWIESHHLRDKKGELIPSAGIIVTGFRTMLVAIAAGGFTAAGLMYTHRSHKQTEKLFQHTQDKDREQAQLTREGQVTGRYIEAIKLLASDKLHERLGGIYSLERIMKDSERDRTTVVEVLAAFVRDAFRPPDKPAPQSSANEQPGSAAPEIPESEEPRLTTLHEDVRAALDVLGRNWTQGMRRADLRSIRVTGIDMREVNLSGAWLTNCKFSGATLEGVKMSRSLLEGADLADAKMYNAELCQANLHKARLVKTRLMWADLAEADLSHADLAHAQLSGTDLSHAVLANADLEGANFSRAKLVGVNLHKAHLRKCVLVDANLSEADLSTATGLTVGQVCKAQIYASTQLPPSMADDPDVAARTNACEKALADGEEPPSARRGPN
ncbi:pentapeptide repeat-containing protein [Streptomyces pseudovenezuelae]|uniref:pentapeptide repeat-containing protein n=1 Tax=Streptomyces pseudovenezuelae TaxID=67350 RepID=UPI0036EED5E4